MNVRSMSALVLAVSLAAFGVACGDDDSPTSPSTVTSVTVTGTAPAVGVTSQFTATARMSDSTTQNVTTQATWQSSNTAAATVSAAGIVTAVRSGTTVVQATYLSVAGTTTVVIP